ncbi:MAG: HlyC/CorC family transporter [Pirellulales bacterium]|nr:HlyC/CorC family transporter [Pirellulales bacterium]
MILVTLIVILLLILANGFFAAAEIAMIASRRGRLEQLAEEGDRLAALAVELAKDPHRYLSTVQVGITLVATFAAVFGGDQLIGPIAEIIARVPVGLIANHAKTIAFGVTVVGITFVSLLLGELVPKRLALKQAELLARYVAPALSRLSIAARPFVWVLGVASDSVLFLLRVKNTREPSVSVDDIEHLIEAGTQEGVLESVEQRVALEALRLGERKVRDVMRPRIDLDALDVNTPQEEVIGAAAMAGFSRLPVYEDDLDHVLGYVHVKDLFRQVYLGWNVELRKLLKPALIVPESMPLDRLLELFQEQNNQLAIVLDEYGGTEGMVTLEDVIEELVGEIREGHRHDHEHLFVERDENSWLVDGGFTVADLIRRLDLRHTNGEEPRAYSTISGLILHELGRIPKIADTTEWNGLRLEVVDMDGQRIDRVLVSRPQSESADAH